MRDETSFQRLFNRAKVVDCRRGNGVEVLGRSVREKSALP